MNYDHNHHMMLLCLSKCESQVGEAKQTEDLRCRMPREGGADLVCFSRLCFDTDRRMAPWVIPWRQSMPLITSMSPTAVEMASTRRLNPPTRLTEAFWREQSSSSLCMRWPTPVNVPCQFKSVFRAAIATAWDASFQMHAIVPNLHSGCATRRPFSPSRMPWRRQSSELLDIVVQGFGSIFAVDLWHWELLAWLFTSSKDTRRTNND